MKLFTDLTSLIFIWQPHPPLAPFLLIRGRGKGWASEASSLFNSPLVSLSFGGKRFKRESEVPILPTLTKRAFHYEGV
jgi:hypothetical protein